MFKKSGVYVNIVLSLVVLMLVVNTFNLPGHTFIKRAIAAVANITGEGTITSLSRFVGASGLSNTIGSSIIYDTGTTIGIGTTSPANLFTLAQATNTTPATRGTYGFSLNLTTAEQITLGADATYAYLQSWSAKPLYINSQGNNVIFGAGNLGLGTVSPGSKLDVKGTLRLSGSTSGYVGLAPAAAAGSTTYTLPSADGTTGQVLSTNGSGVLSWATASGGSGTEVTETPTAGDARATYYPPDGNTYTTGMKFTPNQAGTITKLRMFGVNGASYVVKLWNFSTQAVLATANVTGAGPNNWVEATVSVPTTLGTTYVVTYTGTNLGFYYGDLGCPNNVLRGSITINACGFSASSAFPTTWNNSIHSADITFVYTSNGLSQWTTSGSNIYYSSGNVGIGTTTPTNLFTSNQSGNTTAATVSTYGLAVNISGSPQITLGADATYGYIQSWNSKPLYINSQGNNVLIASNLGIGTTSPGYALDVKGTGMRVIGSENSNSALLIDGGSGDPGYLYLYYNNIKYFSIGANDTYFNYGNVGIGTTSPSQKLDVAGYVKSTSGFQALNRLKTWGSSGISLGVGATIDLLITNEWYYSTQGILTVSCDHSSRSHGMYGLTMSAYGGTVSTITTAAAVSWNIVTGSPAAGKATLQMTNTSGLAATCYVTLMETTPTASGNVTSSYLN